jgi:hypothetical protein
LLVGRGGIVHSPKQRKEIFVGDNLWIIFYQYCFSMARNAGADISISWIRESSTGLKYAKNWSIVLRLYKYSSRYKSAI